MTKNYEEAIRIWAASKVRVGEMIDGGYYAFYELTAPITADMITNVSFEYIHWQAPEDSSIGCDITFSAEITLAEPINVITYRDGFSRTGTGIGIRKTIHIPSDVYSFATVIKEVLEIAALGE